MKFLAQLCTGGFFSFDKDAMIFHLRADHDASESSLFGQSQNLNKL